MAEETKPKEEALSEYERTAKEGKHGIGDLADIDFHPDLIPAGYDPESSTGGAVQHPDALAQTTSGAPLVVDETIELKLDETTANRGDAEKAQARTRSSRDKMATK